MTLLNDEDIAAIETPFPHMVGIMKGYAAKNDGLSVKTESIPWQVDNTYEISRARLFSDGYLCASIDAVTNKGVLLGSDDIYRVALSSEHVWKEVKPFYSAIHLCYRSYLDEVKKSKKRGFDNSESIRAKRFIQDNINHIEEAERIIKNIMWCDEQTESIEIMAREKEGVDFVLALTSDSALSQNIAPKAYGNGDSIMGLISGPYKSKWYNWSWIFFWTDDKRKVEKHKIGYEMDLQNLGLVAPTTI